MSFASKRRNSCVSSDTAATAAAGVAEASTTTATAVESRMYRHNRALMGMNWLTYVDDSNNDDIIDPSKTRFTVVVDADGSSTLNSTKGKPTAHVKSSYVVEQVLEEYRAQKLRNALLHKTEGEEGEDHHDKAVNPASIFKRLLVGTPASPARSVPAAETTLASTTNSGAFGRAAAVAATSFPSFPQTSLESLWGTNDQQPSCHSSALVVVEGNTFSSTYMSPQGLLQRAFKGLSSLYLSSSSSSLCNTTSGGNPQFDDDATTSITAAAAAKGAMSPQSGGGGGGCGFVASSSLFTKSAGLPRSSTQTTEGRRRRRREDEDEGIARESARLSGVARILSADTTVVVPTTVHVSPLTQEVVNSSRSPPTASTILPRSTSPRSGVIGLDLSSLAQELHTGILPQFVAVADHLEHELAPTPQRRDEEDHNHEGIGGDQDDNKDDEDDDLAATVTLLANTSSFFGSASGSLNLRNSHLLHGDDTNADSGDCPDANINAKNNDGTDSTDSPLELGETQRRRADDDQEGHTNNSGKKADLDLEQTLRLQHHQHQSSSSSSFFEEQPQLSLFKQIRNKYEKERFEVGSFVSTKFYGLYEKATKVEVAALAEEEAKLKLKAKRMSVGAKKSNNNTTTKNNTNKSNVNISTAEADGITRGEGGRREDFLDSSSAASPSSVVGEPFSFKTKKTFDFLSRNTTIDEMITFLDFQTRFLGSVNNREFVLRQYHNSLMISKHGEGDEEGARDERAGRRQSATLSPSPAHRNSSVVSPPEGNRIITATTGGGASSHNAGRYVSTAAILIAEEERARPTLFPEPAIYGYLPFESMSKGELLDHCLVLLHHLCGHKNRNNTNTTTSSSPNTSAAVAAFAAESLPRSGAGRDGKAKTAAKRQRGEEEVHAEPDHRACTANNRVRRRRAAEEEEGEMNTSEEATRTYSSHSRALPNRSDEGDRITHGNDDNVLSLASENELERGGLGAGEGPSSTSVVDESWSLEELMVIAQRRGLLLPVLAPTSSSTAASSSSSSSRSSVKHKRGIVNHSKKEILEMIRADERLRKRGSLSPSKRNGVDQREEVADQRQRSKSSRK